MPALGEMKRQGKPISALTAYDYATARLVDEAGIDLILVGDSLAMVVLGHENTLAVTVDEMLHHTRAVRRAVRRALVVADMPFGSYHGTVAEGVTNAVRFLKEAGAEAVKIEGAARRPGAGAERSGDSGRGASGSDTAERASHGRISRSGPQRGDGRAVARRCARARGVRRRALVLEGIPREVAAQITAELTIPTIGIGAGPDCDGQILVFHDLLNLTFAPPAKFVRRYADAAGLIRNAVEHYREDVEHRMFPSDAESYHLPARKPMRVLAEEPDEVVNRDALQDIGEFGAA